MYESTVKKSHTPNVNHGWYENRYFSWKLAYRIQKYDALKTRTHTNTTIVKTKGRKREKLQAKCREKYIYEEQKNSYSTT